MNLGIGHNSIHDANALACGSGRGPAGSPSGRWSMGYYAGYLHAAYPVDAIDWSGLTHLAVAFYLPQTDGSLDESISVVPTASPQLAHALVRSAHAHGVQAIASIGGSGSGPAMKTATAAGVQAAFVAAIVKLLTDYGFDGIDIDWEPLELADRPTALTVANQVRAARPDAILTLAVASENGNHPEDLSGYAALAGSYDQVNIMTYGMAGAYSGWNSWHSSALYYQDRATPSSVDVSVRLYLAAGVPAKKLGVGISFYGLCYTKPVTGPDQPLGASAVTSNGMGFASILAGYFVSSARQWDAFARVPYLSFADPAGAAGCTFISYEDEQSIQEKAAYLEENGLGGVIEWNINEGYVAPANPLLEAVRKSVLQ